ncbi:MAG: hypothetical protein V7L22_19050 [Nostoc sp.]|uniref:hypothetical protein n=1 Tax=Nostoc sp. TaxID=1180 RepID=UPI002FFAACA1
MKLINKNILPLMTASGILFAGFIAFQFPALAARVIVFHDNYAYPFEGITSEEALGKCKAWANRAKKDPNKCHVVAAYP